MKKSNLIAKGTAVVLAVTVMLSTATVAYAEDSTVTDKPLIDMVFENEVATKKMSDEDAEIFAEAMGYDIFNGNVHICSEGTSADVNWENSAIPMEDVYVTQIIVPDISRDDDNNLVVGKEHKGVLHTQWLDDNKYEVSPDSAFDKTGLRPKWFGGNLYINESMGVSQLAIREAENMYIDVTDIYIVRLAYTTDDLGNYWEVALKNMNAGTKSPERTYGYTDFVILPEGVDSVLNLEDIEEDTPADDETVDNYVADLTTGSTVVSATDFATILAENETKDVIIKTNNDVTFTFAKGTMKTVEGLESYDFTTTVSTTYKSDLPSYVTKDNFVSLIDYNYSGKLPAEASIKIPVGTEYAGKTLYYSLMNEDNTYAEVQTVVVDAEGYVTVKQDHCSTYVLTSTEPKLEDSTDSTEPTTDNTTEPTTDSKEETTATEETTTGKTEQTTPETGDNSAMFVYFLLAVSAIGAVLVSRKYKNA